MAESVAGYAGGDRKKATDLALSPYLDGFEPLEPSLKTRDSALLWPQKSISERPSRQAIAWKRLPERSSWGAVPRSLAELYSRRNRLTMARPSLLPSPSFCAKDSKRCWQWWR